MAQWAIATCIALSGVGGCAAFGAAVLTGTGYFAVGYVVFVAALSALQGYWEWDRNPKRFSFSSQWSLCFGCYLSVHFLVVLTVALLDVPFYLGLKMTYLRNTGYWAGLVFAPLSISFYRRTIPQLRLRPGIDNPMEADEKNGLGHGA